MKYFEWLLYGILILIPLVLMWTYEPIQENDTPQRFFIQTPTEKQRVTDLVIIEDDIKVVEFTSEKNVCIEYNMVKYDK